MSTPSSKEVTNVMKRLVTRVTGIPTAGLWGTQVLPVGRRGLIVTYRSIGSHSWEIDALRSGDLGGHWSAPRRIGELTPGVIAASGVQTSIITSDLSSPGPGNSVYTAWADNTSNGHGHVLLSKTLDGGRTWSSPTEVTNRGCDTLLPAVAVSGNTVGVTYYAFRQCRAGTVPLIDVWFALSTDRGDHWKTTHLAGPFDFRDAINLTYNGTPEVRATGLLDYGVGSNAGAGKASVRVRLDAWRQLGSRRRRGRRPGRMVATGSAAASAGAHGCGVSWWVVEAVEGLGVSCRVSVLSR
jgi:hypothetical protein